MNAAATIKVEHPCGCRLWQGPGANKGFHFDYTSDLCPDHRAEHLAKCDADSATWKANRAADLARLGPPEHFDAGTDTARELWNTTHGLTHPLTH